MEGDQRENQNRGALAKPRKAKKEDVGSLFKELRAMMKNHGYPAKGDKSNASQSTSAISQRKEVKFNPGGSRDKQNWVPFFRNYEDFNQMILQSLDGFMIILSTDGVIMFVAENVASLLGHLPRNIVGKKLLTLLHDEEKTEVYRKITMKLPLSCSVGNHVEFCCYLKRANVELEESPTYEYAKFILSLKHICNESLVFFGGFNPKCTCPATSIANNLLWEDQFYFVGTVCILRSEVLKELHAAKKTTETIIVQDSDEEHTSGDRRSVRRQRRSSRTDTLRSDPAIVSLDDEVDIVEVEQYGAQEAVHVIQIDSSSSSETSLSSCRIMQDSQDSSSLQSFEFQSEMDVRKQEDPIDLEYAVDTGYIDDSMDQDDVVDLVTQESPVEPGFPENSWDSVDQEDDVEFVGEEIFPTSSMASSSDAQMHHLFHSERQSSEIMPKSRYSGRMKRSISDFKEAKRFRNSFRSFTFTEDLEETCVSSTQENLEEEEQYLQKQQLQEEVLKQQNQHIDSPIQIEDEQDTIDYYHDEDSQHQENENVRFYSPSLLDSEHSMSRRRGLHGTSNVGVKQLLHCCEEPKNTKDLIPEEQQESFMDQPPLAHSPSSETISLTCFPQSPISSESSLTIQETSENFMQLWQELPSPQHHSRREDIHLSSDENSTQDPPTWQQQVQALDTNMKAPLEPEALQATAISQLKVRKNITSAEHSSSGDSEDPGDLEDLQEQQI